MKIGQILLLALTIGWAGCSGSKGSLRSHKGSYLENVKLNFDAGLEALDNSDFDKALSYFQFVRSKYPFSQYAALSDLKIADAKYNQKKWIEAASAYEIFVRLHPRHEEVPYASYRIGASYFYAVPTDFFLLPKSTSRDQASTKEALSAIDRFLLQYPNASYVADAREKQLMLFDKLAEHNLHVADYYLRRGQFEAAVTRFLSVYELYPKAKESQYALFKAASLLADQIKDVDRAIEVFGLVIEHGDKNEYQEQAIRRIELLRQQKELEN